MVGKPQGWPSIPQEELDRVKRESDIVGLIGSYVKLEKAGAEYKGLCPFHSEKRKVGRPKNIESPEILLELFQQYIEHTKSNPFRIKDWVGKDAYEVRREKERPLTMEGFENYCFFQGVITDLSHYFSNKDERYSDFVAICSRIVKIIRQDQIEGGMASIYNPSVTQRLNGLTDKQEVTQESTVKVVNDIDYSKLSDETLKELLKNSQNKG